MKKRLLLFLLILTACQQSVEISVEPSLPEVEAPVLVERNLIPNIPTFVIEAKIVPFSFAGAGAVEDRFGFVPADRYDARYQLEDLSVLVHVFEFSERSMLDAVLRFAFFDIVTKGGAFHDKSPLASFLSDEDHRVVIWSSNNSLVYVETMAPFVATQIVDAYLVKYPSDLVLNQCFDSDGDNHFSKGETNLVTVGSSTIGWVDVCLRDFPAFKNGQYKSSKGLSLDDGLLEGRCGSDQNKPGFVFEYSCHKGCVDGACNLK
jgi:hypothetical protein